MNQQLGFGRCIRILRVQAGKHRPLDSGICRRQYILSAHCRIPFKVKHEDCTPEQRVVRTQLEGALRERLQQRPACALVRVPECVLREHASETRGVVARHPTAERCGQTLQVMPLSEVPIMPHGFQLIEGIGNCSHSLDVFVAACNGPRTLYGDLSTFSCPSGIEDVVGLCCDY